MTITKTDQKNFAQPPMSPRRNTSPKTRIRSQNQITKPKNTSIVPRMSEERVVSREHHEMRSPSMAVPRLSPCLRGAHIAQIGRTVGRPGPVSQRPVSRPPARRPARFVPIGRCFAAEVSRPFTDSRIRAAVLNRESDAATSNVTAIGSGRRERRRLGAAGQNPTLRTTTSLRSQTKTSLRSQTKTSLGRRTRSRSPRTDAARRASGRRNDRRGKSREKVERTEHDKWRRWAWAALVFSVLGVVWALTLYTILLNRSGDNTAELIALFEESQERRDALARQIGAEPGGEAGRAEGHASGVAGVPSAVPGRACERGPRATHRPAERWRRRLSRAPAPSRPHERIVRRRPHPNCKEVSTGRSSCSERLTGTPTYRGRSNGTSTCCGRSRGALICRGRSTRLATCRQGSRRPSTRCGKRSAI